MGVTILSCSDQVKDLKSLENTLNSIRILINSNYFDDNFSDIRSMYGKLLDSLENQVIAGLYEKQFLTQQEKSQQHKDLVAYREKLIELTEYHDSIFIEKAHRIKHGKHPSPSWNIPSKQIETKGQEALDYLRKQTIELNKEISKKIKELTEKAKP